MWISHTFHSWSGAIRSSQQVGTAVITNSTASWLEELVLGTSIANQLLGSSSHEYRNQTSTHGSTPLPVFPGNVCPTRPGCWGLPAGLHPGAVEASGCHQAPGLPSPARSPACMHVVYALRKPLVFNTVLREQTTPHTPPTVNRPHRPPHMLLLNPKHRTSILNAWKAECVLSSLALLIACSIAVSVLWAASSFHFSRCSTIMERNHDTT